jgi:hypothetical protein
VSARKRGISRLAKPSHLGRRRTDAAVAADSIHDPPPSGGRDYLVQRGVDCLSKRLGAENCARLGLFLAVDDQRGLGLFGYLFACDIDILRDIVRP